VLECPPAASASSGLFQVLWRRQRSHRGSPASGGVSIAGYIAPLAETGPRRGPQNVFHQRPARAGQDDHARDYRRLQRGLNQGAQPGGAPLHRDAARRGRRERAPTKAEVRFREQSLVHEVVRRALTDALGQSGAPALTLSAPDSSAGPHFSSGCLSRCQGSHQARRCRSPASWLAVSPEPLAPGIAGNSRGAHPAPGTRHQAPHRAQRTRHQAPTVSLRLWSPSASFRDTVIVAVDNDGIGSSISTSPTSVSCTSARSSV